MLLKYTFKGSVTHRWRSYTQWSYTVAYEYTVFKCAPKRQKSALTSDQEGAAASSSLIDDVTGVLSVAVTGEATHWILGFITCVKVARVQQARAQTPLVPQHSWRVSTQNTAGHRYWPAQTLTNLQRHRLYSRRICVQQQEEDSGCDSIRTVHHHSICTTLREISWSHWFQYLSL